MIVTALIVSTQNRPELLEKFLDSALNQSRLPDEVIVADNGSGLSTQELFKKYSVLFQNKGIHIRHSWRPNKGTGLAATKNLAIARTKADLIIMMADHSVMESHFVADHVAQAERGCFTTGKLAQIHTVGLVRTLISIAMNYEGQRHGIRIPSLSKMCTKKTDELNTVSGFHMSFWKEDAFRVNGFNTELTSFSLEDDELCLRLLNSGLKNKTVRFSAIAFGTPMLKPSGHWMLDKARSQQSTWCKYGLNQFLNLNEYKPATEEVA